jgi:hypothetical protein
VLFQGGGFTIFIPSLNRERQTVSERLEVLKDDDVPMNQGGNPLDDVPMNQGGNPLDDILDDAERKVRKHFNKLDQDGDGFISAAELRQFLVPIFAKQWTGKDSDEQVGIMMRVYDTDGDGRLDFLEFAAMLTS